MKTFSLILSIAALTVSVIALHQATQRNSSSVNVVNTLYPIVNNAVSEACGYEYAKDLAGRVIYKRENLKDCKDGVGNAYYALCLRNEERVVPMNSYSCIEESDLEFPNSGAPLQAKSAIL